MQFCFLLIEGMVLHCAVRKCKNTSQTPGVSMYRFPSHEALKTTWSKRILSGKRKTDKNIELMRVCSAHFKSDDFKVVRNGKKVLKKDAKPTIFLSSSCKKPNIRGGTSQKLNLKNARTSQEVEKVSVETSEIELSADSSEINDSYFANLPDVILFEVFNRLSFEDRYRAGCVCRKWYKVFKSPAVWKKVDVKVKDPYHLLKFLLLLPCSVTHLSIFCETFDIRHPLWLPDILSRLHERSPGIKSLILENVFLSQRFCNAGFTTDHVSHSLHDANSHVAQSEWYGQRDVPLCLNFCCNSKINRTKYVPENRPQDLCILSLRYSRSYMCHLSSCLNQFMPKIKVLDLTYSASIKDAVIPFFARLIHLQELYLVGCPITNSGIENLLEHLKTLQILDLEGSRGVDGETFEIIQTHGLCLEKLYLGHNNIKDLFRAWDAEEAFPKLQMICLKNTLIDDVDVLDLIFFLPSLKYIDVSFCNLGDIVFLKKHALFMKKKLIISELTQNPLTYCHHFKTKYMCCD